MRSCNRTLSAGAFTFYASCHAISTPRAGGLEPASGRHYCLLPCSHVRQRGQVGHHASLPPDPAQHRPDPTRPHSISAANPRPMTCTKHPKSTPAPADLRSHMGAAYRLPRASRRRRSTNGASPSPTGRVVVGGVQIRSQGTQLHARRCSPATSEPAEITRLRAENCSLRDQIARQLGPPADTTCLRRAAMTPHDLFQQLRQ
jgi:hypothetical protein